MYIIITEKIKRILKSVVTRITSITRINSITCYDVSRKSSLRGKKKGNYGGHISKTFDRKKSEGITCFSRIQLKVLLACLESKRFGRTKEVFRLERKFVRMVDRGILP